MAEYQQIPTVKVARPDTPEGYMIINQADYREGLPQYMYQQGLAYNPADWPVYVEGAASSGKGALKGADPAKVPEVHASPLHPSGPQPPEKK
jgi:hypothetical protein